MAARLVRLAAGARPAAAAAAAVALPRAPLCAVAVAALPRRAPRWSARSFSVSSGKQETGLTGVPVVANAREVLVDLYNQTLALADTFPQQWAYAGYLRALAAYRLKVVEAHTEVADIERVVNCGQIEELIVQAEREMSLANYMLDPSKIPLGLLHHENLEGADGDASNEYYTMVQRLIEQGGNSGPPAAQAPHADAFAAMMKEIYAPPAAVAAPAAAAGVAPAAPGGAAPNAPPAVQKK